MKKKLFKCSFHWGRTRKFWTYMKWTFAFLLIGLTVSASNIYSQQVRLSLDLQNATTEQVLNVIQEKTEFDFFYESKLLKPEPRFTAIFKDVKIETVLDFVLAKQNLTYQVLDRDIAIKSMPVQQKKIQSSDKEIQGIIKDTRGEPLPGVAVYIKGTNTGVVTDINGMFKLIVPENASVLVCSFIGMSSQEIQLTGQKELDITMKETSVGLDEVIAIGYGSVKKSDVTGSVVNVTSKNFNKGVITSPERLIQGRVAGLTITKSGGDPTQGTTIRLRGSTSLKGGNAPLVVIDGVPGASFDLVAPDDIESISVLKDASASAIYGARSANGVIIVTTKKGNEGKASITYNGYISVDKVSNKIDLLSADEWRAYVGENNVANATDHGANTSWMDELLQTGSSQNHNLSIIGATKNSNYRASVNYLDQSGIVLNNDIQRLNLNFAYTQKALNDKLIANLNVNSTQQNWTPAQSNDIFKYAFNFNPTIPVYDENGEYYEILGEWDYYNPVGIAKQVVTDNKSNSFLGNGRIDYNVLPSLTASVKAVLARKNTTLGYYQPTNSAWGRNVNGFAQRRSTLFEKQLLESTLAYKKESNNHKFDAIGGYSYETSMNEFFGGQSRDFATDNFSYNNLDAGLDLRAGDVYSGKFSSKLISFFGRVNYMFDNKYMIAATVRHDGSSKFGKEHKWGTFPSASVAWRISRENFMNDLSFVDDLKFRFGYGVTGNEAIQNYLSSALYNVGGYYFDNGRYLPSYVPSQNPNPDLKWEETTQLNAGIDFHLFNGMLRGSVEVYNKYTKDLLFDYPVPSPPYIYDNMMANVGEISNKGFELLLETTPVRNKNFSWDVSFNFAKNKNTIEKLSNDQFERDIVYVGTITGMAETSSILKEGESIGTFYGAKFLEFDEDGKFVFEDVNQDGEFKYGDDRTIIGCAQPDFTINLSNSFQYKNFDLGFLFRGVFGHDILNGTYLMLSDVGRLPGKNVVKDALSIVQQTPTYSSYFIEDGSYVRLETLSLGYKVNLPKESLLEDLRLYVNADNLFLLTNYSGIDPEVNAGGNSPGVDAQKYYPKATSLSLGLKVTF